MKKTMKIEGMMCGHCEAAVKKGARGDPAGRERGGQPCQRHGGCERCASRWRTTFPRAAVEAKGLPRDLRRLSFTQTAQKTSPRLTNGGVFCYTYKNECKGESA